MLTPVQADHELHPHRLPGGLRKAHDLLRRGTSWLLSLGLRSNRRRAHSNEPSYSDTLVGLLPAVRDRPQRGMRHGSYHEHRPFALASNFDGYQLSRRRRAALPQLAGLAFAYEVLLPCAAPMVIAATLRLAARVMLIPLGWVASGFAFLDSGCAQLALGPPWLSWLFGSMSALQLPSALSYFFSASCLVFVVGVLTVLSFFGNVTTLISMLSTLRETGVRRRVCARLLADPEAELEELIEDGETSYSIEDLRIDGVRLLLDVRSMLFYAHGLLAVHGLCGELWDELDSRLGASGLRARCDLSSIPILRLGWLLLHALSYPLQWLSGLSLEPLWSLNVNPFYWLWGIPLPAAAVCFNALVAHIEPIAGTWCAHWTASHLRPTWELLEHGFEAVRLYAYMLVVLPLAVCLLAGCLLPSLLVAWLRSDEAYALVPGTVHLCDMAHRLAMALDLGLIAYALACFRTSRRNALSAALMALVALLGPALAVEHVPTFGTWHRALLLATIPPFSALLATLAPLVRGGGKAPPAYHTTADAADAADAPAALAAHAGGPSGAAAAAADADPYAEWNPDAGPRLRFEYGGVGESEEEENGDGVADESGYDSHGSGWSA